MAHLANKQVICEKLDTHNKNSFFIFLIVHLTYFGKQLVPIIITHILVYCYLNSIWQHLPILPNMQIKVHIKSNVTTTLDIEPLECNKYTNRNLLNLYIT